jgi:hypothetical protein
LSTRQVASLGQQSSHGGRGQEADGPIDEALGGLALGVWRATGGGRQ